MQTVLLFGSEIWVLNPHMGRDLRSFQHRVARWITVRKPNQREHGGWEYPLPETAMEEAGFEDMGAYVLKRQNTVAQYITMWPIMDLCKKPVRRPGQWFARRWWYQEILDLAGARAAAAEIEDAEEGSEGEEEER